MKTLCGYDYRLLIHFNIKVEQQKHYYAYIAQ